MRNGKCKQNVSIHDRSLTFLNCWVLIFVVTLFKLHVKAELVYMNEYSHYTLNVAQEFVSWQDHALKQYFHDVDINMQTRDTTTSMLQKWLQLFCGASFLMNIAFQYISKLKVFDGVYNYCKVPFLKCCIYVMRGFWDHFEIIYIVKVFRILRITNNQRNLFFIFQVCNNDCFYES